MLPAVSEMHQSQQLDLFPGYSVTQCLFKDVRNAAELRKSAVGGEIQGALINPSMIVDPFQIVVAANKAFHLQKVGKMKTRSLYSEVIFNLSPTNNISESFKKFGIADNDNTVLIVLIHSKEDEYYIDDIRSKIDGEQIPVELISTLSDVPKIKKYSYQLPSAIHGMSNLHSKKYNCTRSLLRRTVSGLC